MICPKCQGKTKVYNSRPFGDNIRRHRLCLKCGHKYSTLEILEVIADEVPKEKPVVKRKPVKKKRFEELDFDSMTDEEIEKAMFNEDLS
mgnify:FL=1